MCLFQVPWLVICPCAALSSYTQFALMLENIYLVLLCDIGVAVVSQNVNLSPSDLVAQMLSSATVPVINPNHCDIRNANDLLTPT